MLARIPFGLTTGPIEGAEILVAGCRKETVASEMRSNVLKYRDTLLMCQVGISTCHADVIRSSLDLRQVVLFFHFDLQVQI
jgi:hypothetical protein